MATTRDYVDYLSDQIDIAPVNSQEELQAAELLQHLMEQHQLDVRVQEFEAPSSGVLPYRILMVLLFLGVLLAGFYGTPVAAVGIVLVFVCGALFLLRQLGYDLLSGLGGTARSQNVIGVHRAEGPLVVKGNRPIVIVAHYDTPRESLLYKGPIARVQPMLKSTAPILVGIAFVMGIFQLFGFVPVIARRVLWVVGLIVALPLLFLGIDAIYSRFSSCTEGANDNKSSLAAMLSVLDKVRPGEDSATGFSRVMDDKRAVARAAAAARMEEEERARAAAAEAAAAEAAAAANATYDEDSYDMELDEYDEFDAAEELDELSDEDAFGSYADDAAADEGAYPADEGSDAFEEPKDSASPFASVAGAFSKIWPFSKEARDEEGLEEPAESFEDEGDFEEDYSRYADEAFEAEYGTGAGEEEPSEPVEEVAYDDAVVLEPADEDDYDKGVVTETADEPELEPADEAAYYDEVAELEPYEEPVAHDEAVAPAVPLVEPEQAPYDEVEQVAEEAEELPQPQSTFVAPSFVPTPISVTFDDAFDEGGEDFSADADAAYEEYQREFAPAEGESQEFEQADQELEQVDAAPAAEASPAEPQPFIPSFARVRSAAVAQREPVEPVAPAEPEVEPQVVTDRYEEVVGVRHGKEVVESLRMLPVGCEVEYIEPRLLSRTVRPQDEIDRAEFGVISASPSEDWEPILHSNRHDRPSYEERPSFFERVGNFFTSLRDQFFGEEVDDDTMPDAEFDDDFGYEDEAFDDRLDASYWDDPAGAAPVAAPADEPLGYAEDDYAGDEFNEAYEGEQDPLDDTLGTSYVEAPQATPQPQVALSYDEDAYAAPAPVDRSILAPNLKFQDEPLPTDAEIDLMDGSGLTEVVDYDLNDSEPRNIEPAPKAEGVDDPTWGRSEYQPPRTNVARRASLFDLPDPNARSADPFADDPFATSAGRRSSLRLVDDDEDPRNGRWKGGATTRTGLRDAEEDFAEQGEYYEMDPASEEDPFVDEAATPEEPAAEAPSDVEQMQELRDAILSMGDDELIAHDIWFVALGASELNHAGMTAFLRENRSKIRGAFMVNLDSIGAGMLTMLTREGLFNSRKTDRRMLRMLGNIADDLHISVDKAEHGWEETDATQAMRKSVRALTIMGVENGVAALSHTAEDTAEEVNPAQVADVAAMVTELIRRA